MLYDDIPKRRDGKPDRRTKLAKHWYRRMAIILALQRDIEMSILCSAKASNEYDCTLVRTTGRRKKDSSLRLPEDFEIGSR